MPDAVFVVDSSGIILAMNPGSFSMYGYTSEELKGRDILLLSPADLKDSFYSELRQAFSLGTPHTIMSQRIRKDGSLIHVRTIISPIMPEIPDYNEYSIIDHDITDVYEAQQELETTNQKLKSALAAKNRFFSVIAHDLKNPFISLIGLSRLLSDEKINLSNEKRDELIREINSTTKRLYYLLTNLLEWANSQTGRLIPNITQIDISEIVKNEISLFQSTLREKPIVLYSEIENGTHIKADANMTAMIIRNLISNAIKYTNAGGRIIVGFTSEENEQRIFVKDNGAGISEADLDKINSPDSIYTTKGTNKEEGSGLGLFLCREFAEKIGGRIHIESQKGKGTTVSLILSQNGRL
jgi:PAS domain S-box-containing protein